MTPKQANILTFIRKYRAAHGYSPTLEEIGAEFGVSKVTAFEHVEALIRRGQLRRVPNIARGLVPVDDDAVENFRARVATMIEGMEGKTHIEIAEAVRKA